MKSIVFIFCLCILYIPHNYAQITSYCDKETSEALKELMRVECKYKNIDSLLGEEPIFLKIYNFERNNKFKKYDFTQNIFDLIIVDTNTYENTTYEYIIAKKEEDGYRYRGCLYLRNGKLDDCDDWDDYYRCRFIFDIKEFDLKNLVIFHSPFTNLTNGSGIFVRHNGTVYIVGLYDYEEANTFLRKRYGNSLDEIIQEPKRLPGIDYTKKKMYKSKRR